MAESPPKDRLLHSIADVSELTTLGRTVVFEAIRTGRLKAVKAGKRTLIRDGDLRAFVDGLPSR